MAKMMLKEEGINIPMITTLHGTDITLVGSHPFYKTAVTFSINKSDIVTAVSENLKDTTFEMFEVNREIEVVPNFIDAAKYAEMQNQPCDRNLMALKEEFIITHVSNFRPVKRIEDVILIFKQILDKHPAVLVMVGEGSDRIKAERLSKELGIYTKVKFLGNSVEIDRVLCMSDLFLLPSGQESFGLAALEAMINKTPVISSNAGGLPEVNIHGLSGYVAEIGDVEKMGQYALDILKDSETLNRFKENARKAALEFDLPNILPLYVSIYEKAYKARKQNSEL
jgi:N-acetyl-alpha-D-glucosaminyl L-malate synthase BshA